ncbi:FecR family protein [Aquimarina sp. RZ0]|uniref:FecR family protein n=1 Tax=Aquimarina sp. RZ0 TaxID=2607730 RepID=UPI0011F1A2C2|nr:FecR domain-containing protein [Aquimarina sp. RZ0]KAA1243414.1 DUF4974 domain-containing protein [Aquimarina sp. RZ0]
MNPEEEDHIIPLITSYLQNEVNSEERRYVEHWIHLSESNKLDFEKYTAVWEAASKTNVFDSVDIDQQWDKFLDTTKIRQQEKKRSKNVFFKIAASVVILLGLATYFFFNMNEEVLLVAKNGKENKFVLPDATNVWLNKGSQLIYSKGFNNKERKVTLKGEAFFDVTKDLDKPFLISCNETITKVLGTSFNLKGDPVTRETELILLSGRVEFSSENGKKILEAGDKISASPDGALSKTRSYNPNFSSWRTRKLIFEKTLMDQVIKDVEIRYRKKIRIEDNQFRRCKLTASYDNESFEDVLQTFKILFGIHVEYIDSETVVIKGGSCKS